jgi:hypothetical protein
MKSCAVEGCTRRFFAKGMCSFHYKRKLFGRELTAEFRPKAILHKTHPFYVAWVNMKTRCDNPNSTQYKYYGGRGITYDPLWKNFRNFYNDMFETWHAELELDRKDTNRGYSYDNCRWVTHQVNCNNKNEYGYLEHT